MSIFLRPVVIVAIALLLLPACATVEIRLVGCSVVAEQPESNAVHYEYRDGVVARKDGEFIVIWIAANGNLEDRARSVTHHLFFKVGLFDSGDGYEDLAGGLVLRAEGAELAVMGDNLRDREGLYKCYFRTDVKFLDIERGWFTDGVSKFREAFRNEPLRIRFGGGTMWGARLSSNSVRLPIILEDGSRRLEVAKKL